MANIRNSISLQDHMTPVFRSILRSMDSTLRLMKQIDRASNNGTQSRAYRTAARDIQRANNELLRMQNNLKRTDIEAGKLQKTVSGVGSSFSNFRLSNIASGLYLIKNAVNALSSAMEIPDSLNVAEYRLGQFDKTEASGSQLYNAVYKTALDSRADLGATADLASRILISGATKGNGGAAIQMAGILNKASLIGGATQEESKRALLQLSQGLSSGALQGDELRAIREQAPGLTDALARGLSSMAERGALPDKFLDTAVGDLKKLGAEGELTSDRIIGAFAEVEDYINETFEKSPKTFGQAITGIGTVWKNFFKQMSQSDRALGKLNEKAWELLEYFTSPAGEKFFNDLSIVINLVVGVLVGLIDIVGDLISNFFEMDNAAQILQAGLIGVATAGVIAGISTAVAFVAAHWKILLVIGAVAALSYALMSMGATAGEVVGYTVAFILAALAVIWNTLVILIGMIINIIVFVGALAIIVIQAIVQAIIWLFLAFIRILALIGPIWDSFWWGLNTVVGGVVVGIAQIFQVLATIVLGILWGIAKAIDAVFGSNLSDSVKGWMKGLDTAVDDLEATFTTKVVDGGGKVGDSWKTWGSETGEIFTRDEFLLGDNMASVWNGQDSIITGIENSWDKGTLLFDVGNAWNSGIDLGKGVDSMPDILDAYGAEDMGDLSAMLAKITNDGVNVNGGNIDSVGSIKSDVDISDEDLQLLRDIAARDFLMNVKTVTPKATISFGDVRETADVNKIVEVIENMVDEQLATALVVE